MTPMATNNAIWLADVLGAEGLDVVEFPGWQQRGHGDFGDIWGVICHHTGADEAPPEFVAIGTPTLAGPLSQVHVAQDAILTVVAAGVAWHAGAGRYPGLSTDRAHLHTIGVYAVNTGTEGWSSTQYEALVCCCAAIVRKLGQPASHVIGNKERSAAKWDPGALEMPRFRADIAERLDAGQPRGAAEDANF